MAKKTRRAAARKHQRPQTPPLRPAGAPRPQASAAEAQEPQEDFAATAIPYVESDGPMPLPPTDEEEPEAIAAAPVRTATPAATPAGADQRRRIGRVDPAARVAPRPGAGQRGRPSTAAMFEPLPPEDAAIPFDRVPYVPGDLRRVAMIATVMIILIVVADFVVNAVVK